MSIVHDLVEIGAGDTFVYDLDAQKTKSNANGARRTSFSESCPPIKSLYFRALWNEFEAKQTPESQFAGVLDRLLPILLNFSTRGQSWRAANVKLEQVRALNLPN
jgi:putative hydrolase of HD superfamily